jgi:hypothetical protein
MLWNDISIIKPEPYTEVLVWIDSHRSPSWRNRYALVAYMTPAGEWHEERHKSKDPLIGVLAWAPITKWD